MLCSECSRQPDTMSCPPCSHKNCQCDSASGETKQCTYACTSGSESLCGTCGEAMKRCQRCTREIIVEKGIFTDEVLGAPLPSSDLR